MILQKIRANQKNTKGTKAFLPYPKGLGMFSELMPGRFKNDITAITGGTSSSKSSFLRYIIFEQCLWAEFENVPYKCLWFALEESEEQIEFAIMSYLTYKLSEGKFRLNIENFTGMKPFPTEEEYKFMKVIELSYYPMIRDKLIIKDHVYNSYGIYKEIRNYAFAHGKFFDKKGEQVTEFGKDDIWETYESTEEGFVEVVVDHLSELSPDKKETDVRQAMSNLTDYVKKYVSKKFNYSTIIVQQQAMEMENLAHIKENQVYATIQGLGDAKTVARVYRTIIGITNINRYGIKMADCKNGKYMVKDVEGYQRVLEVLKRRFGRTNDKIFVSHDGKVNHFGPIRDSVDYAAWTNTIQNYKET